jgi:hypothetical protein
MDGAIMASIIVNKEPMDYFLVDKPVSVGIKDLSYRSGEASFGLWKLDTGLPESMLFITRRTYPDAILVNDENEALRIVKDADLYQKYLDLQPPDYGEQQYYSYRVSGERTDLLQAHLPQDLVVEFKTMCAKKRVKIREAMAVAIAEWISKNDAN